MVSSWLGKDGQLIQSLPGFKPRAVQLELAEAIEEALHKRTHLIAEAGTGIGKTYAYLVPAILSNEKILISTGTKNLQDQLYHRDLPAIVSAMKMPVKSALLKGRGNYLCLYRIREQALDGDFYSRQVLRDFRRVERQTPSTRLGDINEIEDVKADSAVWPMVTSTSDNCLGAECDFYDKCYLVKARKKAQQADIVVVNHHLFFADLMLKETGFAEILPDVDALIFDEAHQLPDIASQFFGDKVSSRQLLNFCSDTSRALADEASDCQALSDILYDLESATQSMITQLCEFNGRFPWSQTQRFQALPAHIKAIAACLSDAKLVLEMQAERSAALKQAFRRAQVLIEQFSMLTQANHQGIHWYESFSRAFVIHLTPLSIAERFIQQVANKDWAVIMTSATLACGQDFGHFAEQLGLEKAKTLQCLSPFDYKNQCQILLPRGMRDPKAHDYTEHWLQTLAPFLYTCGGGVFCLFTSFKALESAYAYLSQHCPYPLFVQNRLDNTRLLDDFRRAGNGVLLGTYRFWEGVDVVGDALKVVIIDKLPFESIGDPILKARMQALKAQGLDSFQTYQLPKAVLQLKQGVGRLIRSPEDQGTIIICDPRMLARDYAKVFIDSLPNAPIIREMK